MWFFRAVAVDLDGTVAHGDQVDPDLLEVVGRTRKRRAVVLVTGRVLADLRRQFPGLVDRVDAVVAENGCVLRTPSTLRLLAEPVDAAVSEALEARGVRTRRGDVLLEIDGASGGVAADVIAETGADHQVVHNRAAGMVLPAGVTKATGLRTALDTLGLSTHNAVALGDAENDLSMLRAAEVGAAVADAVPSLARQADLVLAEPGPTGVAAFLEGPLLAGHQRLCPPRRWVEIGRDDAGRAATVPGSQSSVLVTGDTGSGKSYFVGLLAERWIDAGYSVLVVDPEGDHEGLAARAGVHVVDVAGTRFAPGDALEWLRPPGISVVLDLSRVGGNDQLDYLDRLADALAAHRMRHGVPHWVVYDEAHLRHATRRSLSHDTTLPIGTCLATWRPDLLPARVRSSADVLVDLTAPSDAGGGKADVGVRGVLTVAGVTTRFTVSGRESRHVRHRHKYARTMLPADQRFFFRGGVGDAEARPAASLEEFEQTLRHCDLATLEHHMSRGDFSRWVSACLRDAALAAELAAVEQDVADRRAASLEDARQAIRGVLARRYFEA